MINPPHILTAYQEREILREERERDRVYCRGDMVRYAEVVRDLDFLNKRFFEIHGYCFHSQGQVSINRSYITTPDNHHHSQGKKGLTDRSNELNLGTRSRIGVEDKSDQMPISMDNHPDNHYPTGLDDRDYRGVR